MVDNILFYKIVQWCKVFNCKTGYTRGQSAVIPYWWRIPFGIHDRIQTIQSHLPNQH